MGIERIDICLPGIQIPLEDLHRVKPEDSHLKKLVTYPSLKEGVTRRAISFSLNDYNATKPVRILGYSISDWVGSGTDSRLIDTKYFSVEALNALVPHV